MKNKIKLLECIFEALDDGVLVINNKGRIIKTNTAIVRVTGLAKEIFEGQHIRSLYEKGYFSRIPIAYKALLEKNQ
uniref:PAS domain S-box protein n=1 Tax=candidate division WOR-3 bacterium TaxID=2052148 RepID=A0A7C2K3R5_UNCW3